MHGVRVGTSLFTNGQKKEGTKSSSVGEQTARSLFSLFVCYKIIWLRDKIFLCVHFWCLIILFVSETRKKTCKQGYREVIMNSNKISGNIIKYLCSYCVSKLLILTTFPPPGSTVQFVASTCVPNVLMPNNQV